MPFYNDTWIFVWDLHATRLAILDSGRSVFETRDLFHPDGISLAFHTLAPLYGALAIPLEPWLGLVATYNVLFLSTFVLSALAARHLAWRLTGSPGGSFLAGFLFAFSPYHQAHAPHLNLLSLQFLPLTAAALLALVETASLRAALALAVTAAASFYACLEYALFSALLALVVLLHGVATSGRGSVPLAPLRPLASRCLVAAAVALLLVLPGLIPLLAEAAVEQHYQDPVDWQFSADLLSWITPSVMHSLWGGYTMKVYQHFPGVLAEWTTYVGVVVALLGIAAWRARSDRVRIGVWVTVAVVFAVLAMGPRLRLAGTPLPLPLPYALLDSLPLLSAMREPSRFAALVTLATSMLAAFGFRALRAGQAGRWVWLALPLAALDFASIPLPTSSTRLPAFYADLARERDDFAVLDVPADLAHREHLYRQAVHGKRVFVGYIARIPAASRRWIETLPLLADPAGWEISSPRPGESSAGERFVRLARALDVRYALVQADLYARAGHPERFARALANLERLPGARVVAREEGFAAVRIDGR